MSDKLFTVHHLRVEDTDRRPGARAIRDKLVAKIITSMKEVGFSDDFPITVRKSGNRYIIMDGQHRVEAARALGIEEVPAKLKEFGDSAALTYEGIANLQDPDTEAEMLARAQEFFDLEDAGVPVTATQVYAATGLDAEQQEVVKRVRKRVNDPEAMVDQGSFDRILALDEFIDDAEAVHRILTAPEASWRRVVAEIRRYDATEVVAPDGTPSDPDEASVRAFIANGPEYHKHLIRLLDAEVDGILGDLPVHGRTTRLAVARLLDMPRTPAWLKALKADGYQKEAAE